MKNPHAVALGRRGGLKGGKARMAAMTAHQRRAFARQGGKARQAARRVARQEFLSKLHDGRWLVERQKPLARVDWHNRARDRSVGLLGERWHQERMWQRIAEALHGQAPEKTSPRRTA